MYLANPFPRSQFGDVSIGLFCFLSFPIWLNTLDLFSLFLIFFQNTNFYYYYYFPFRMFTLGISLVAEKKCEKKKT